MRICAKEAAGVINEDQNQIKKMTMNRVKRKKQILTPEEFNQLMQVLPKLAEIENRTM